MKWDHKNKRLKSWTRAEEKAAVAWAIRYGFNEDFDAKLLRRFMNYILIIRTLQGYDILPEEGINAICILSARYTRSTRNHYIFTVEERKAIKSLRLRSAPKRSTL